MSSARNARGLAAGGARQARAKSRAWVRQARRLARVRARAGAAAAGGSGGERGARVGTAAAGGSGCKQKRLRVHTRVLAVAGGVSAGEKEKLQ